MTTDTAATETSKELVSKQLLPPIPAITDEWVRAWIDLDNWARSRSTTKGR